MDELKIELKDGYNALKEIFYQNGSGNLHTWKGTKGPFYVTLIFCVLSMIFFLAAMQSPETHWIVLTILTFVTAIFSGIVLVIRSIKYITWKKSIESYLAEVRKYDSQWLTLNPHTLQISNSDETIIEKWENIKQVSIKRDYISLKGDSQISYIFPEKSMTPEQFITLQEFIRKVINKDEGTVMQEA